MHNEILLEITKGNAKNGEVYPCTIVCDRYSGVYSGGKWIAFNLRYVPDGVDDGDIECAQFWDDADARYLIGKGNTPGEAFQNLIEAITNK